VLPINQIICGDCLKIIPTFPEKSIDLIIIDPPYNIGIDKWDRIKNYYSWLLVRFQELERVLKDTGTLWLFHIYFPTLVKIHYLLENQTNFKFKQFITINKGIQSIAGRSSKNLRSYPRASEYVLFYTFQDETGLKQIFNSKDCFQPIKKYLRNEREKTGLNNEQLNNLCGTATMINHYFGDAQWAFPTREIYEKLQKTGFFRREYEDLRREYEDLRREYEDLRYTFNCFRKDVTRTWLMKPAPKIGYVTPKPIVLIEALILHSSNEDDIVLDPFLGSGTTAIAAKNLNRKYIGIEINPEYVELTKSRKIHSSLRRTSQPQDMMAETDYQVVENE